MMPVGGACSSEHFVDVSGGEGGDHRGDSCGPADFSPTRNQEAEQHEQHRFPRYAERQHAEGSQQIALFDEQQKKECDQHAVQEVGQNIVAETERPEAEDGDGK
jgi:hypothetical protein